MQGVLYFSICRLVLWTYFQWVVLSTMCCLEVATHLVLLFWGKQTLKQEIAHWVTCLGLVSGRLLTVAIQHMATTLIFFVRSTYPEIIVSLYQAIVYQVVIFLIIGQCLCLKFVWISTFDLNLRADFVFVGVKSCKYSILLCTHIY